MCALCLAQLCSAQQNKLAVAPPESLAIQRGHTAAETLKVVIAPGFHVNSDKPKDEFLIPLKLTWASGPLEVKSITYPKPEEIKVGQEMLTVFTGTFEIRTEFRATEQANPGASVIDGKLHYQACNNQMCFRPATVDVRLPILIN